VPTVSPNQPRTPIRGVRVPDPLWQAVQECAASEGRTASDATRALFEGYVSGAFRIESPEQPQTPPLPEG